MFLSAVWTLILTAPIHCRRSFGDDVVLHFSKYVLRKKQTNLYLGWPEASTFTANVLFLGELFL